MTSCARFAVCAAVLVATFARAERLEFNEGAASAYIDLMTFIVNQVEGSDRKLDPQQKKELVADVRARWDKAGEASQRRVLDSPRLFIELMKAWRSADEATREQMRRKWAEQLGSKETEKTQSKKLTPQQQEAVLAAQRMAYESKANTMRAYHEMSMAAIRNINSDTTWRYEYRRR